MSYQTLKAKIEQLIQKALNADEQVDKQIVELYRGRTNCQNAFANMPNLLSLPNGIDLSESTTFGAAFMRCENLKRIPDLKNSIATNHSSFANYCDNLETVENLNVSSTTNISHAFNGCRSLKSINFVGEIPISIDFGSTKALTVESMQNIVEHLKNCKGTDKELTNTVTFWPGCWTALEASGAAPDGGTWQNYVVNTLGWNI